MDAVAALRPHLPAIAGRAAALDEVAGFPHEDVAVLREAGVVLAPLPRALGGCGAGTEPAGAGAVFSLLRMLGRANASVGRVFEAHVNAVRLVVRFGTGEQLGEVAARCRAGGVFGLWVTDAPGRAVRVDGGVLLGAKGPCSGAGHLRDALVTMEVPGGGTRMGVVALSGGEAVKGLGGRLHGMRAAANGTVVLDGVTVAALGGDGDCLAEPDFSTGAWRTMAVTLGLLEGLVGEVRRQVVARGHGGSALQQARYGELMIAQETVRLWTWEAAQMAEAGLRPVGEQVAYVNLARIAVESSCLDALRLAQRSLGLPAMVRPNPAERMMRDLATYLRQPAADMVLCEAAEHGLQAP